MNKSLIITIGPSSLKDGFLDLGFNKDYIFRINAAHVPKEGLGAFIDLIRKDHDYRKILVDIPGNKIRLKNISNDIQLKSGEIITLNVDNFNHSIDFASIKLESKVLTNDGETSLFVDELDKDRKLIKLRAVEDSVIINGKGMHFVGNNICLEKNIFNQKDLEILEICNENKVDYIGVSYIRSIEEIQFVESLIRESYIQAIYKIETKDSIENLYEIVSLIDWAILDRGDLSSEIGILNLYSSIDQIINACSNNNVKLFVATQILSSLKTRTIPNISDILDLQRMCSLNLFGFQFSDETAIGLNPLNCIKWIESIQDK